MGFADNMKGMTQRLRSAAIQRTEAVTRVSQEAKELLSDLRVLMERISQEHQSRAREVHNHLARAQQGRQELLNDLHAMITDRLNANREAMNRMLEESHRVRQEGVGSLLNEFEKTRKALAADLQEAGRLWREHSRG